VQKSDPYVLLPRIELGTSGPVRRRSTAELQQRSEKLGSGTKQHTSITRKRYTSRELPDFVAIIHALRSADEGTFLNIYRKAHALTQQCKLALCFRYYTSNFSKSKKYKCGAPATDGIRSNTLNYRVAGDTPSAPRSHTSTAGEVGYGG
jgi:hypothetical protein